MVLKIFRGLQLGQLGEVGSWGGGNKKNTLMKLYQSLLHLTIVLRDVNG